MRGISGLLLAGLLFVPAHALADVMKIQPGQWQFKSVATIPMSPTPMVDERTECVRVSEIDPKSFLKEIQSCSTSNVRADAGSMSWSMACPHAAGQMTGDATFTSTGDSVTGQMQMSLAMSGGSMQMSIDWKGRRLGPCEPPPAQAAP